MQQLITHQLLDRIEGVLDKQAHDENRDLADGYRSRANTLRRERNGMLLLLNRVGIHCGCTTVPKKVKKGSSQNQTHCACGLAKGDVPLKLQRIKQEHPA